MKTIQRIESIDGLRFMAFLMVMLYHYLFSAPMSGLLPNNFSVPAFYFGDFGVDLFFLISGFVISMSSEGRSPFKFLKSRVKRIFPTFIIFSLITLIFSSSLPMVEFKERIINLIYNLTFFPQAFGYKLFSDVYWTIQKEVAFYAIVFFMMLIGVWKDNKKIICLIWIVISYFNTFLVKNSLMEYILVTTYAGHFVTGIIIYEIRKNGINQIDVILLTLSTILIYNRMIGFNEYIAHSFNYSISSASTLLSCLSLISIMWSASNINKLGYFSKLIKLLGSMTYPLYLIHADVGFWSHAIFERLLWIKYPVIKSYIDYKSTIIISVIICFSISFIYIKFISDFVDRSFDITWNYLSNIFKRL